VLAVLPLAKHKDRAFLNALITAILNFGSERFLLLAHVSPGNITQVDWPQLCGFELFIVKVLDGGDQVRHQFSSR
jgi:hypothetical protein